jgi:hypothetical protein
VVGIRSSLLFVVLRLLVRKVLRGGMRQCLLFQMVFAIVVMAVPCSVCVFTAIGSSHMPCVVDGHCIGVWCGRWITAAFLLNVTVHPASVPQRLSWNSFQETGGRCELEGGFVGLEVQLFGWISWCLDWPLGR